MGLLSHSFRIGAVSEVASRGALEAQLRMMDRWMSNAYMRYVRPSQRMPLHSVGIVGFFFGGGGLYRLLPRISGLGADPLRDPDCL